MGSADSTDATTPGETVLHEVAEREGVAPESLTPRLHEVVDPDALDAVLRGDTGHISFEYCDYVVTVDHAGDVRLEHAGAD